MKPTAEVAQALTNLRVSPDFATVIEWLRYGRELARDDCERITDGPRLWRAQGRSLCLSDILAVNENAAETLQKFKPKP